MTRTAPSRSKPAPAAPPPANEPKTSAEVRARVLRALHADLVGPFAHGLAPDEAPPADVGEVLPIAPSRWYLTGFLASAEDRSEPAADDPDADDAELAVGDDIEADDEGDPDPEPKRNAFFPSSLGVSLILKPAIAGDDHLVVDVCWADYVREQVRDAKARGAAPRSDAAMAEADAEVASAESDDDHEQDDGPVRWRRQPERRERVVIPLAATPPEVPVPDSGGLRLQAFVQKADAPGLYPGSRAVSLFLVNGRPGSPPGRTDESYVFQVGIIVRATAGFVPRPDLREQTTEEDDGQVADLQYREVYEWAVGHGVAVESKVDEGGRFVRTTWIPCATVKRVVHRQIEAVETRMDALATLDAKGVAAALGPLADAYGAWIDEQSQRAIAGTQRQQTRDALMGAAAAMKDRIAGGVALLARRPEALEAFRRMNRAMADAGRKRQPGLGAPGQGSQAEGPRWRLFQLAFILVNLRGIADDTDPDRENVELIFFPTGGGKTEAYLGLIAYTLVLRRLMGRSRPDQGLGVAVILRYTLRLLTLDQLARAATMICALELQRRELEKWLKADRKGNKPPNPLGDVRFSIGLWVGRSATANTIGQVARDMVKLEGKKAEVFPLTECPWCQEPLQEKSIILKPSLKAPEEVVVSCAKWACEFSEKQSAGEGLPVLFVDEQIYRELPSFIIATVDKYAMTPWRGEVGMLFGRATAREGRRFYGTMDDKVPAGAVQLGAVGNRGGLPPPELIVQDELHLIAGPLGTMTGLYETAIEHLTRYEGEDGRPRLPKIVASTATVRAAGRHVCALFGRKRMSIFPPQGIDPNETFFSQVDHASPGRDYVGVAASGRRMKQVLLRTYIALLAGAGRWYRDGGKGEAPKQQPVDPYMTLVGYFNSLRELGGMRRLVEDEVRTRCLAYDRRVPVGVTGNPHMGNRKLEMPIELTSRESTQRVKVAKDRLHVDRAEANGVDVLLASNMISVGVDIDRLGLMVVAGQPKTTAEYIQATSRVGRDPKRPGLVVTCFNFYKARDRSHYEHFGTYHAALYRRVEAGSLTPFSGPALDRGLAGVLVALTRHWIAEMAPPEVAMEVAKRRDDVVLPVIDAIVQRSKAVSGMPQGAIEEMAMTLRKRLLNLVDTWEKLVEEAKEAANTRRYSNFDRRGQGRSLLVTAMDLLQSEQPGQQPLGVKDKAFLAPTSMRDVEPSVHVYVDRKPVDATGPSATSGGAGA